jgi:hypothetical protein
MPAAPGLPNRADQTNTLGDGTYDRVNWDMSANSFRNKREALVLPQRRVPPRIPAQFEQWSTPLQAALDQASSLSLAMGPTTILTTI